MRRWYRSRTLAFNALLVPLAFWAEHTDVVTVDPTWLIVAIAAANIALRAVTSHPITWRRR